MILQGRTALVTGATRGIGLAVARRLAAEGAQVAICGRNETLLEQVKAEHGFLGLAVDVAEREAVQAMIRWLMDEWGHIDIVVNNAGITRDGLLMRMSEDDWQQVLNVNLTGAFHVSQAVIRPMMKQRSGRIINISSVVGFAGSAGQTNYAAAKAGLIGFTKALAKETASRGILINAIAPGYIDTDMTAALTEQQTEWIKSQIPLGDTGKPDDVAGAVVFLASDDSRYITGQTIHVNGGLLI